MGNREMPFALPVRVSRFKSVRGNNGRCANCGHGVSKHTPNGSRLCPTDANRALLTSCKREGEKT